MWVFLERVGTILNSGYHLELRVKRMWVFPERVGAILNSAKVK